jgi:hypothetical protein
MARQAFDALRIERIRTAPAPLVAEAEGLAEAVSEISEIVAFGFDAAASEMAGEDEKRYARALELAVEGLNRAADSLGQTSDPLEEALDALDARVGAEVMSGIGSLAGRALAHRVQGRLLDARTRLAGTLHGLRRWAGPGVERWVHAVRVRLLGLRRLASRGLGWTRSLVGVESEGPTAATRTARSLARVDDLVDALPLVYQHLFAAEPLSDPALMAGRDTEVAEVEEKWRHWQEEEGIPLLVTGRRGSGVSSFFNVFVSRIEDAGARTLHRVLDRRITSESELAAYLAELLGMEAGGSLDDLASEILGAPAEALPDLVAVEGLEHLYLRVPGGTDLLERLFTLMAETERRMFWVGSITPTAWQVVEKSEPAVAAQLDQLELRGLSAAEIQTAVLLRHRRSGLRIHYEEPVEGRRLLRRRVRRLRGTERHQHVLEGDYFDRLHKSSLGNLRLAFFQWLRSVDFADGQGRLVVHPLAALDFSFLDSLNLTQNFTVKAFLEHSTLTLAEHDAVFRVTRQESYHVFESLGNRHVIEAVPRLDDGPAVSEVRDDIRYRIRPLLAGAVAGHLASKNIVH